MDKKVNLPLSTLLYFIDDNYKRLHRDLLNYIPCNTTFLKQLLSLAEANKLLFVLSQNMLNENNPFQTCELIRQTYSKELEKYRKFTHTLKFIKNLLTQNEVDFVVIKTFKSLPNTTNDLDILVRKDDLEKIKNTFLNNGATVTGGRFIKLIISMGLGFPGYKFENTLDIDIYWEVPWPQLPSVDINFLWRNQEERCIEGEDYKILKETAELLTILSSTLYTDREITLLDFLYITRVMEIIDKKELNEQLKDYGWNRELIAILDDLRKKRDIIYKDDLIPRNINFPYLISIYSLLSALPGPFFKKVRSNPRTIISTLNNIFFHCFFGRIYARIYKLLR